MKAYLIQIDAWSGATATPVRLASHNDERLCHLDGETWWPAIAALPTLRYDFFDGAFDAGSITSPSGDMSVAFNAIPTLPALSLHDTRIRIWRGELGDAWGGFSLMFDGRVQEQPSTTEGIASLKFGVDDSWLDQPLLATYGGTGGADGPPDMKGEVIPLALGAPRFAPATLVDAVDDIYQISGHGAINAVEMAFERLNRFGAPIGDAANFASLKAATIAPGRWATCLTGGYVRFGAPPDGLLSFHVQGDAVGGWSRKPGDLIARIATIGGGAGKFSTGDMTALNAARPWNLSIMVTAQTTARELIQRIAASVNAVAFVDWLGQLRVAPIGIGTASLTLASDGSALPPVASVEQVAVAAPYWKIAQGAAVTWQVHGLNDIAFNAPLNPRGPYSASEEYREGDMVTLPNGSQWLFVGTAPATGSTPGPGNANWYRLADDITAGNITYEDGTTVEEMKPAEPGATNSANPASPLGPDGKTVADVLTEVNGKIDRILNPPSMPGVPALTSRLKVAPDQTQIVILRAAWTAATSPDLGGYIVRIQENGSDWVEYPVGKGETRWEGVANAYTVYRCQVCSIDTQGNRSSFTLPIQEITTSRDTTPPAVPTGLTVSNSLSSLFLEAVASADADLDAIEIWENAVNSSGTATRLTTIKARPGATVAYARSGIGAGVTRYYWMKAVDTSGNVSGFSAVASGTTPRAVADDIADGIISMQKMMNGLAPVELVTDLPSTGNFRGRTVMLQSDGKLYRWNSTATTGTANWTAKVDTTDLNGQITNLQIENIAAVKVTGQLTDAQIAAVAAAKLTGQIVNSQIADIAAVKVTGQLSDSQIAAVAAAKLTGQITSTQINDNAITTPKIAAGAVTANEIAAGSVIADKIAANAVTTAKINAGAVTANELATNSVTAVKILAGAVTAGKIAANAVTATEIASGTIVADNIAANAITTAKINAGAVTANELATNSVTAVKIAANAVTTDKLLANSVTTAKIAAGAVTANEIAAATITGDKIVAGTISGALIAANAITASRLVVADLTNLAINNWTGGDLDGWTRGSAAIDLVNISDGNSRDAGVVGWMARSTDVASWLRSRTASCSPGEQFYFEVWIYRSVVNVPVDVTLLQARFDTDDGTGTGIVPVYVNIGSTSTNGQWIKLSGFATAPANVQTVSIWCRPMFSGTTGLVLMARPVFRRASSGELIVDGAILAQHLATNSVTATKIAAGAVTADSIATNAVTTAKINAGAVTANEIAANAVTTAKIATNAVTANEIAANAVTTQALAANAVTADKIAANTITARNIIVADLSNQVINNFTGGDMEGWAWSGPFDIYQSSSSQSVSAGVAGYMVRAQATTGWLRSPQFTPGKEEKYYYEVLIWRDGGPTTATLVQARSDVDDGTGTITAAYDTVGSTSTVSSWVKLSGIITARANAKTCSLWIRPETSGGTGRVLIARPVIRRATSGEILVNGSVTADKIAANAVTATHIAANTITATSGIIANGAITSAMIGTAVITSAKIGDLEVDTIKIANNAVTVTSSVQSLGFFNAPSPYSTWREMPQLSLSVATGSAASQRILLTAEILAVRNGGSNDLMAFRMKRTGGSAGTIYLAVGPLTDRAFEVNAETRPVTFTWLDVNVQVGVTHVYTLEYKSDDATLISYPNTLTATLFKK